MISSELGNVFVSNSGKKVKANSQATKSFQIDNDRCDFSPTSYFRITNWFVLSILSRCIANNSVLEI